MASVTEATASTIDIEKAIEEEPDGLYEFVGGKFVEKPLLGAYELALANILGQGMNTYAKENRLGQVFIEMIFRLKASPRLDRRPDIAFVSNQTWSPDRRLPRTAAWEIVPDLAIEVISPTNYSAADARKIEEYFQAGTKAVWMIYPDLSMVYVYTSPRSIAVFRHGDILEASPILPGFRLVLSDFFDDRDSASV